MICGHGSPVATVQILHPEIATQRDLVCAECCEWWERWAEKHPQQTVLIQPLPDTPLDWLLQKEFKRQAGESSVAESVLSAILLLALWVMWLAVPAGL